MSDRGLVQSLKRLDDNSWRAVLEALASEGLGAVADAYLQACGMSHLLPGWMQEALRKERLRTLVTYTQRMSVLPQLKSAFQAEGVQFQLLKGFALAHQAYKPPEARSVGDIDIWVRPPDVPRASRALQGLGLRPVPESYKRPRTFLLAYGEEVMFSPHAVGGLPETLDIDLHWHLIGPWWLRRGLSVPERDLFAAPHMVTVEGEDYPTLSPTDHLYYLCLHAGAGHGFEGLRWLVDLALLLRSQPIDWPRLNRLVRASHTFAIVWHGLYLLDLALGTSYRFRITMSPTLRHRLLLRRLLPAAPKQATGGTGRDGGGELSIPRQQLALLPPARAASALMSLAWPTDRWLALRYSGSERSSLTKARARHIARLRRLLPPR
ncbi:MAG TPA: nucleotidyltransferase family protein [Chloroflexia bacterium]